MQIFLWCQSLIFAALLVGAPAHKALVRDQTEHVFRVAHVYYFGYEDLNLKRVEENLPIKAGERMSYSTLARMQNAIRASVLKSTGKPATDVAVVCCTKNDGVEVYVGLRGKSYRSVDFRPAPKGNAQLGPKGEKLYEEEMAALVLAVKRGDASENDANGYALTDDPATRRVQLAMRAWALHRGPQIAFVLGHARSVQQRTAAAALLGYAKRSKRQIAALMNAAQDENAGVRNNAVRALGVLAAAKHGIPVNMDIKPLVNLLYSGKWLDRNKASMLLMHLTKGRNPELLKQLRQSAMAPLIEGAKWDEGHAGFFLTILGRIGGIPEAKLEGMISAGDGAVIIAAAEAGKD